ncbi:MAG TPA: redoxin domain-containing protein [Gemmatimonadota bacterium]|jgi:peroxiredoxin
MTVVEGDSAPAFALPPRPRETVNVGEHLGRDRVVLLFFPLAFSSTCTAEMCRMRDDWDTWRALDARVFGITVDSPFVTERFRQAERLPFPILSDFNRDVATRYGVLYEELLGLRGVPKRAVFVIGRDGRVAWRWVSESAGVEPPYEEIRAAVERAP